MDQKGATLFKEALAGKGPGIRKFYVWVHAPAGVILGSEDRTVFVLSPADWDRLMELVAETEQKSNPVIDLSHVRSYPVIRVRTEEERHQMARDMGWEGDFPV